MSSPMITAIRGLLDAQGWDDEIQTPPASGSALLSTSLCIEGHWCDLVVPCEAAAGLPLDDGKEIQ